MFGNCVWYQLKSTHNLNQIIYNFHKLFGSDLYGAHLTADYNVLEMKDYPIDSFVKNGRIYKTSQDGFYALQQDYFMQNRPSKLFHVSLAYKNGKDFTDREINFIESCHIDEVINKEDIQLSYWNCNSKNPRDWKLLKKKY